MKHHKLFPQLVLLFFLLVGCESSFLEIKRDKSLVIPTSIGDFQALLENDNSGSSHELSIIGSDELLIADQTWNDLTNPYQKNGYIWDDDVYEDQNVHDWDHAYNNILIANTVLEGVEQILPKTEEVAKWENVKGSSLFYRTWYFYQLSQLFSKAYDAQTADNDPGIPLRLTADITAESVRSSVEAVYQQMITDLEVAVRLLPEKPLFFYHASMPAAYALLSRIFLQMGKYDQAGHYADLCLKLTGDLLDFNKLDLNVDYPFPPAGEGNPEVIFMASMRNITILNSSRQNAHPELVAQYQTGDLRRQAYFNVKTGNGRTLFTGSYTGDHELFTGLTTGEVLLTRAECFARQGKIPQALEDLNKLLKHRYITESFASVSTTSRDELLNLIVEERRKELAFRGTRWEDLRRLNRDPRFSKRLVRKINGTEYTLPPGDPRWTWPIPDAVIDLSGMDQNPR